MNFNEIPHPTLNHQQRQIPDFALQLQSVPDDIEYLNQYIPFETSRLKNVYQPNPMRYFAPEKHGMTNIFHHVEPFDLAERAKFQQSFDEKCFETVVQSIELLTQKRIEQKQQLERIQREKLRPVQIVQPDAYVKRYPTYEDSNKRLLDEAILDQHQPRMHYVNEMPSIQQAVVPAGNQFSGNVKAIHGDDQVTMDRARDLMMNEFMRIGGELKQQLHKPHETVPHNAPVSIQSDHVAIEKPGAESGQHQYVAGIYNPQANMQADTQSKPINIDLNNNQIEYPPDNYEQQESAQPVHVQQPTTQWYQSQQVQLLQPSYPPAQEQFQHVQMNNLFQPAPVNLPHTGYFNQVSANNMINMVQPNQLQQPPQQYAEPLPMAQIPPQVPAAYVPVPPHAVESQSSVISSGIAASYQTQQYAQPNMAAQQYYPQQQYQYPSQKPHEPVPQPLEVSSIPKPQPQLTVHQEQEVEINLNDEFGVESQAKEPVTVQESPSPENQAQQPTPEYKSERPPSVIQTKPKEKAIEDILKELSDEEDDDDDFDINKQVSRPPRSQKQHKKKKIATNLKQSIGTSEISDSFLNKIGKSSQKKKPVVDIEDNDLFSD